VHQNNFTSRHDRDHMTAYPQQRQSHMQSTMPVKSPKIAARLSSEVLRNTAEKGKLGAPEMTHSRQSAMAPIIPIIHSPKQVKIPARQETMIPISRCRELAWEKDVKLGCIGVGPSRLLYDPQRAVPPHPRCGYWYNEQRAPPWAPPRSAI
jgi:hypothetical protein